MRLAVAFLLVLCLPASLPAQTRIIYDTDMDTDCDDAGALAILHALTDRGEAEILATVVSSRYPWSVPCVEAIKLIGVRSEAGFWKTHTSGHNHIFENGTNQWREGPETNHRLVKLQIDAERPLRETLDQLMIQAPRAK